MDQGRKQQTIKLNDFSGGVATAYPTHAISDNQAAELLNVRVEKRGFAKAPAYTGISAEALFTSPLRGWFVYKKSDGSEAYIAISGQKMYSVGLADGTKTEIGAGLITSDAECFAVNSFGKLWIANGTDVIKVESDLAAYRVGIVAPTGFTASATGAGTLAAGAYKVAVSYARKIGSTIVLYSAPQLVATVTVNGTQLIRIVCTASTDPQVTHIVAWVTNAGGSDYYYFGETDNATGNFDIANDSNKNSQLLMYEQATANQLPGSIKYLWSFDGRLFGATANSNDMKYSLKAQNVYDLERWPTEYHVPNIPFTILGGFGIGSDMYVNTPGGPYQFPRGDVYAKPQAVIQGGSSNTNVLYFPANLLKTVVEYNGVLMGFTNDGFRIFDGVRFSIDLSKHIKPQVDSLVTGAATRLPAAVIYRRSGKRTEYQASYCDTSISTTTQGRRLVLNLDKMTIVDNENYLAPWEIWSPGFSHALVTSSNNLFVAQEAANTGVIAQETGSADIYCISDAGSFLSTRTDRRLHLRSKTFINELAGIDQWQKLYYLARLAKACVGNVIIIDNNNYKAGYNLLSGGGNPVFVTDATPTSIPFVLPVESPTEQLRKLPPNARGNSMAIEIEQIADDAQFFVYEFEIHGFHERNLFV